MSTTSDASHHWSLPRGRVLLRALASDPLQEYFLYIPTTAAPGAPMMVSVHGTARNASKHPAMFSPICDTHGAVMLAPIFTPELHQDYQRLGRTGRGHRADRLLHRFLKEAASLSGADPTRVYLFGFSAGAQFVHRYLMAHPHRVAQAAVAAAGWYTFPDRGQRYPYGIRPARTLEGVTFNPEEFLGVPVSVLVGALDTTTANMRQTARTVAQQGSTRLERARNWVAAMREAAAAFGLEPRVTLTEVPGVGHSFTTFCEQGNLVERVRQALFGSSSTGAASAGLPAFETPVHDAAVAMNGSEPGTAARASG